MGRHYHLPAPLQRNDPAMRLLIFITAIFCFSALPQASHSLSSSSSSKNRAAQLPIDYGRGGTSSMDTQPSSSSRRALRDVDNRLRSHIHGVKVEMQRIELPCGLQKTEGGGLKDHQRLRCAVERSSLRAQAVRKGPRVHAGAGSKAGVAPPGSTTAGREVHRNPSCSSFPFLRRSYFSVNPNWASCFLS